MNRTPIKRDPEKTRAWQQRSRQPIPRVSPRRARLRKARADFRAMVLRQRYYCEAHLPGLCSVRSTEVNEIQRGPAREDCWLDWDRVTALCSLCHHWLTHHPDWAVRHGHQLPHEQIVTEEDWERARVLREHFRRTPCTPDCTVDHR